MDKLNGYLKIEAGDKLVREYNILDHNPKYEEPMPRIVTAIVDVIDVFPHSAVIRELGQVKIIDRETLNNGEYSKR